MAAEGIVDTNKSNNVTDDANHYRKLLEQRAKESNLSEILKAFNDIGITSDELFICDLSEIKGIIKEQNISMTITQRIKFTKIVMEIKEMKNNQKTMQKSKDNDNTNFDLKRVIAIGSNAVKLYDTLQKFEINTNKQIAEINKACKKAEERVNGECKWSIAQLNIFKKLYNTKLDFYRNLCVENVTNIQDVKSLFLDKFWCCISNKNVSMDEIKKQLTKISEEVERFDRTMYNSYKYNLKIELRRTDITANLIRRMKHSDINIKLLPSVKLKCVGINGNIVSLEWSPKPWEDPNNKELQQLLKWNDIQRKHFSFIIQFAVYDDEQKNDDETGLKWENIYIQQKSEYMDESYDYDIYDWAQIKRWKNKCQIHLNSNTSYKFRIKYRCKSIGESDFGDIISAKTAKGKPLQENITKYVPSWSNIHKSSKIKLTENNSIAALMGKQFIRGQQSIQKGMKVTWEFIVNGTMPRFGIMGSTKDQNDSNELGSMEYWFQIPNVAAVDCQEDKIMRKWCDWIDNIHTNSTNRVKIIVNYLSDKAEMLFIVNNLLLTSENEKYSIKLKTNDYVYPFVASQLHDHQNCSVEIKSVV